MGDVNAHTSAALISSSGTPHARTLADAEEGRHGVLGRGALPLLVALRVLEEAEEAGEEVERLGPLGEEGLVEALGRVLAGLHWMWPHDETMGCGTYNCEAPTASHKDRDKTTCLRDAVDAGLAEQRQVPFLIGLLLVVGALWECMHIHGRAGGRVRA